MENFRYCSPTLIDFGKNVEENCGELAKKAGFKNALIVIGSKFARTSGLLEKVENSLHAAGIKHELLEGVKPNPTDDAVRKGIDMARAKGCDSVLAVGGGSVIDTAKAIAIGVPYSGDFWDFYCGKAKADQALPVGVVLTIPGAGSEGSPNSVITLEPKDGSPAVKLSLRTDTVIRPKFSIVDPQLTFSISARQTAIGIVDMMAHIMERYFSPSRDVEVSDRLAEGLLMAIINESDKVMKNLNDYEARANIEWASTLAHNGIVGCGRIEDWSSHAMEHEISAQHPEVAHGEGLAIVFPAWMTYVARQKPQKIAQFGRRVFNIVEENDSVAATKAIDALRKFYSETLQMPLYLSDIGLENIDIDALSKRLHINKGEFLGNYIKLTDNDTCEIYRLMLHPSA